MRSHSESWLLGLSFGARSGLFSCPRLYFRLLPSPLPGGSALFCRAPLPPPAGMRTPSAYGLPSKRIFHMSRYAVTHVVPAMGNHPESARSAGVDHANLTSGATCSLFPSSIQVLPIVVPTSSAMLVLFYWD